MSSDAERVIRALHPELVVDGRSVEGEFVPLAGHQGNPGWLHGGLAATVMDHVCARAASAALDGERVVTARLDIRYRSPVPIDSLPYLVRATADPARGSRVRVRGAIVGANGKELVSAKALFVLRTRVSG